MSELNIFDIKDNIDRYTALISFILKADIEAVDRSLNIISKQKSDSIYENSCSDSVYNEVFETKRYVLLDNPRKNIICQNCEEKNRCLKKIEFGFPIMVNDDVIGVIGISSYSISLKESMIKEFDKYSSFINTIIALLENDISRHVDLKSKLSMNELFKSAIDIVDKAYIVYDENGRIIDYNAYAKACVSEDIKTISIEEIKNDTIIKKININGKDLKVLGSELKYYSSNKSVLHMLIFSKVEESLEKISLSSHDACETGHIFIGRSENAVRLKNKISALSKTNSVVLITGKSGSGKEHAARSICYESSRYNNKFVKIDCKGSTFDDLECKIFGFATSNKEEAFYFPGKLQMANNGVLYIENVEYLPVYLMRFILKAHNEKKVYIKEHDVELQIDFKLICSSNELTEDLLERLDLGDFVNFMPLSVPALCERREDIGLLFEYFMEKIQKNYSLLADFNDIIALLENYNWPGNIKELEFLADVVCANLHKYGSLNIDKIEAFLYKDNSGRGIFSYSEEPIPKIGELEGIYIKKALEKHGRTTSGKKLAAKELGIGVATLYRKIKEYNC